MLFLEQLRKSLRVRYGHELQQPEQKELEVDNDEITHPFYQELAKISAVEIYYHHCQLEADVMKR